MKLIPLSQGQFAKVDDEDFDFLMQWKWYAHKRPCTFYAERGFIVGGKKTKVWMHRLINSTPPHLFTDHIDGDGLNNQRANLRAVTHRENMINRARWRRETTSRFRGAYLDKRDGRWASAITVDGRPIYLGRFATEQEANAAFEAARKRLLPNEIYRVENAS